MYNNVNPPLEKNPSFTDLPEELIGLVASFFDYHENILAASSCHALWSLLNKNRYWDFFVGIEGMSTSEKQSIFLIQNIIFNGDEEGVPEYTAKEFFLRVSFLSNHKAPSNVKVLENTQLRKLLFKRYFEAVFVFSAFFNALAFHSTGVMRINDGRKSVINYMYFTLYALISFFPVFLLTLQLGTIFNTSLKKLPNIVLLKSIRRGGDVLPKKEKALVIYSQGDKDLFLDYPLPIIGYRTLKVNPFNDVGENPDYTRLSSLFSSMGEAHCFILQYVKENTPNMSQNQALYWELINMIRNMHVPVNKHFMSANSVDQDCAIISFFPWLLFSINVIELFSLMKRSFASYMTSMALTISFLASIYLIVKKVIEACYGSIERAADAIPFHHQFYSGNQSAYFQHSNCVVKCDDALNQKKSL